MVNALGAFGALLAAAFLFITGNGLLNTLLSTRMAAEGLPDLRAMESYFFRRMADVVAGLGKIIAGWDEIVLATWRHFIDDRFMPWVTAGKHREEP